jgi:transposase-like protein
MRHGRGFWKRVVAEAEASERTHAQIAARHGVQVAALRSWIYRLRREGERGGSTNAPARLLPVRVTALPAARETIDVESGDVTLRVPVGCDPEYVASLLRAVRTC